MNNNDSINERQSKSPLDAKIEESEGNASILGENSRDVELFPAKSDLTAIDIMQACPDVSGKLSNECITVMDEFFLQKIYSANHFFTFIIQPSPLTYDRIFTDPIRSRDLVFDALEREECYADHEIVRPDLNEVCHVDAIEDYLAFLKTCSSPNIRDVESVWSTPSQDYEGKSRFRFELEFIEDFQYVNPVEFELLEESIHTDILEARWLNLRCSQFDLSEFEMLPGSTAYKNLTKSSVRQSDLIRYGIRAALARIAVVLGGGWPVSDGFMLSYLMNFDYDGNDTIHDYYAENHSWILDRYRSVSSFESRTVRLRSSIELVLAMEELGWDVDLKGLVKRMCSDSRISRYSESIDLSSEESSSCADAIRSLNLTIHGSETNRLRVLDQIERLTLELGVYDLHEND
ncbi:MAG: hypothetical protein OXG08_10460 [Gammaproteobacteria bacterium]|nr:hypothetical protein [Gammaproteobacteria bacterium]